MASAPDENESGATAELQQLKVEDEDYNPFTEEGKKNIEVITLKFPGQCSGNLAAYQGDY
jgi:hypothetical protein